MLMRRIHLTNLKTLGAGDLFAPTGDMVASISLKHGLERSPLCIHLLNSCLFVFFWGCQSVSCSALIYGNSGMTGEEPMLRPLVGSASLGRVWLSIFMSINAVT